MHRDGVPDEDRKRLYQHARLGPPEMDAINNLTKLGQEVTKVEWLSLQLQLAHNIDRIRNGK